MSTILVINPGSTSTKIAAFANHKELAEETIRHSVAEIDQFTGVISQSDFRKKFILDFIQKHQLAEDLIGIVGRGGMLKPIPGGTYSVDGAMLADLKTEKYGTHASNLGGILAAELGEAYSVPAFIVDPVVVDELLPIARASGLAGIERRSVSHVLNQKAVARRVLSEKGLTYNESAVIVAHLGGGVSIGAHKNGKMIDVTNGLDGEGPYSPERSGSLPLIDFAKYIIEKELSLAEVKSLIGSQAGMKSYLNETDLRNVTDKIEAGGKAEKYYLDGMCYQVAKAIGEMSTVLTGEVDQIILTGGAAYSTYIVDQIKAAITWIAPVEVLAGEMEMTALYEGALRVLTGDEAGQSYGEAEILTVGVE